MFQKLVSHNEDIRRLAEKGYALGFDSNYMVIRDISYLNGQRQLEIGAIVTKLVFVDQNQVVQDDHQVFFAGSVPHNIDGTPIPNLGGGPTQLALSGACPDVIVQRSFSNKPRISGKFQDFYEKIESYVSIISGPAMELYDVTPYTFRIAQNNSESVFKFHDTLTSRAEIGDLASKFHDDVVAIVGLGGTGAYVLDFLAKTPVREIRAFDLDHFHVHNAFRSPGRLDEGELGKPKAEVYGSRYENFRSGLKVQAKFVDSSCTDDFEGVTFAFICVDKGSSRAGIFDLLIKKGIPFIDVGMGLSRKNGPIGGMVRTSYFSVENGPKVKDMAVAPLADNPDNLYKTNIQIGELNALNAALAVIRFKQLRSFYFEEIPYYNVLYDICDQKIVGESET
ncbi:ThiF family adenylyltransferase [Citrifermentans bremense]|uniref:ThiF family adenylyltransferase n=1 Tax=Citrifermentans bremense TaxID=60035 RepID=UPI0003FBD27F|nr:ThiF family adenylyltransferase [Citrifermentans bremense]